jgi:MFS family permease
MSAAPRSQQIPGPVRRLLVSHALASVGMSLPWPLLLVLVWDRTGEGSHGDLLLGLTAAARMLPYVLLSWATGMLADRFRRDRLVRLTLGVRGALLVVVAVAVAQGWLLVAVLAAALAIACGTPAYPALAAAMPGAAGPARRRATDLLVTIEVASFVVGPAIGGLLLAGPARSWSPVIGVLLTLLALASIAGVVLPRPVVVGSAGSLTEGRSGTGTGTGTGIGAALRASSSARRAIGVAGLLNAVDAVLLLALLPVSGQLWHAGDSGYGLATGLLGFGAVGAPLLWRLGSSARSRARWGLLLLGGSLLLVPVTPAVGWAALPLVVAGAATVHVEGAVTEAIQDAVPDSQRAGALGLTDSVMVGAALAGSLVAPWLSSALGPRGVLLFLAAASVATVAALGRHRAAVTTARVPAQRTADDPVRAPEPSALVEPDA